MNTRAGVVLKSLMLVVVLLFSGVIPMHQANADDNVDISVFQDALAPYGNWVNHRTYGQVWYPRNVARDWRPYTDGYWAHTDDYGWLWVSYQPWGWAPFHYGRWAWDNWYGWIWVPGRTWAPAWVFWRSGGGYAAWTPMPPNVVWQPGIGLNISYFNYDRDIRWDSWVAVHEHDLPNRHINQHINPPSQNRQIINVTHYNNNITLINNTIVNQGVPVKQIEEVTRRPLETVVPKVHDRLDINTAELHEGQPDIIRLPMAAPTPDEMHHNEELARRLDGKNPDGTRTELPLANSGQAGEHEPRVPGRLVGAPAPVQAPYAMPEPPTQGLVEPVGQALPEPVIPKAPLLSLDPDMQHKALNVGSHQETLGPAQQTTPQSSVTLQPIAPVPSQIDGASVSIPVTGQQPVLTDAPAKSFLQNEPQPSEAVKPSDNSPSQAPAIDQVPVLPKTEGASVSIPVTGQPPVLTDTPVKVPLQNELKSSEAFKQSYNPPSQAPAVDQQQMESLQRQQKIDQLQQELARSQNKQQQQETGTQPQQLERPVEPVQQIQQPEAVRQQPIQNQQPIDTQPQQVERPVEAVQQMQQSEAVRQPPIQNQQQVDMQPQQLERPVEPVQQNQQPEAVSQQPIQNQQQVDTQPQQAERAQQEAQQMQQQEVARQQQIQNQQQTDMQSQQAERAQQEAQQMQQQQQEAARQQQIQNQQQVDMQSQQAERAQQEAQQMQQQQEAARQQQIQTQQQVDIQSQQAERVQQEARQMQLQQETARQQQIQTQQPIDTQPQQVDRAQQEAQQIQQQEAARQQQIQNQQQVDQQSQQAERAQQEAQQIQQQEAARQQQQQQQPASQPSVQNQQPPEIQRKQTERPKEEPQQIQPQQAVTPQ